MSELLRSSFTRGGYACPCPDRKRQRTPKRPYSSPLDIGLGGKSPQDDERGDNPPAPTTGDAHAPDENPTATPLPPGQHWREYKQTSKRSNLRYAYDRWREGDIKKSRYRGDLKPQSPAEYERWKAANANLRNSATAKANNPTVETFVE